MPAHQRTSPRRPGCGNRCPKTGRSVAGKRETGGTGADDASPNGAGPELRMPERRQPEGRERRKPDGAKDAKGANHVSFRAEPRKRRRRGIAVIPRKRPLGRDECDSSSARCWRAPAALRASARNDGGVGSPFPRFAVPAVPPSPLFPSPASRFPCLGRDDRARIECARRVRQQAPTAAPDLHQG